MFKLLCHYNNYIIEVLLLVLIICLLVAWFFQKKLNSSFLLLNIFMIFCLIVGVFTALVYFHIHYTELYGYTWLDETYYCSNTYFVIVKLFIIILTAAVVVINYPHFKYDKLPQLEFIILIIAALFGMCVFVSCADFLSFYLAFELQSFAIYILVSIKRYELNSVEAGFKYFVMGSFASVLLLFGISIIFVCYGSINFDLITTVSKSTIGWKWHRGSMTGLVLVLTCLFFKLPAAPFHTWAPDVYQGAPTGVVAFLVIVSKFAIVSVLVRLLYSVFIKFVVYWSMPVGLIAAISIVVGTLGAISQQDIKRFFAFSTINHVGFILLAFSTITFYSVSTIMFYLISYAVLSLNFFAVMMAIRYYIGDGKEGKETLLQLSDFVKLRQANPILAALMCFNLFSFAGVPPLVGFFAKFFVINLAVENGLLLYSFIAVMMSVLSTYYYIRIIASIYFQNSKEKVVYIYQPMPIYITLVACVTSVINIGLVLCPHFLMLY